MQLFVFNHARLLFYWIVRWRSDTLPSTYQFGSTGMHHHRQRTAIWGPPPHPPSLMMSAASTAPPPTPSSPHHHPPYPRRSWTANRWTCSSASSLPAAAFSRRRRNKSSAPPSPRDLTPRGSSASIASAPASGAWARPSCASGGRWGPTGARDWGPGSRWPTAAPPPPTSYIYI